MNLLSKHIFDKEKYVGRTIVERLDNKSHSVHSLASAKFLSKTRSISVLNPRQARNQPFGHHNQLNNILISTKEHQDYYK